MTLYGAPSPGKHEPAGGTGSDHVSLDLALASGRLRVHRYGSLRARLVVAIPGITANLHSFDVIAPALAEAGMQAVALDLRGRGMSETTSPGTYGWEAHARDVLDAAQALGATDPVDLVGHSMGAYVAMQAAVLVPEQVRRIVLVDALGPPERGAAGPILAALERLGSVQPSADDYLAVIRAAGAVAPWGEVWERHYAYDLREVDGGVTARTSREAVFEDAAYAANHDATEFWRSIVQPVLVVRAARPVVPGGGFVVAAEQRDRFLAEVPTARSTEIDANHYGVLVHGDTAAAVVAFLR